MMVTCGAAVLTAAKNYNSPSERSLQRCLAGPLMASCLPSCSGL